jgi:hypothetical protein
VITAAILSTVFLVGGFIEIATRGYGNNVYFFRIEAIWEEGWWVAWLAYFAIAVFMFVVGFWAATIYKRWGTIAITVVLVGLGLLLVGAMWLTGRLDAWGEVIAWFGAQGALGLTLWGILLTALLAGTSYLTLRRADP